jgi:hypothetical protein
MDQPENSTAPLASSSAPVGIQDELASWRAVLLALLGSVFCLGAALGLYLYRQNSNLTRQTAEHERNLAVFKTNSFPAINWFIVNLQAFAKTNPDFTPILAKYNALPPSAPSLPAASPPPAAKNK